MGTRRIMVVIAAVVGCAQLGFAMTGLEAIEATATWLDSTQLKFPQAGSNAGSWPNEKLFTGSIVAGMVGAFDVTGDVNYLDSAVRGGQFLSQAFDWSVDSNNMYYGDQAYALARISQIPGYENKGYRESVEGMYDVISMAGTENYASWFLWEPDYSTGIFYLANHVVAAYEVNAVDKKIWRDGLIVSLGILSDEEAGSPVMALCVATWALAKTGPLDDTLIVKAGCGGLDFWIDKKLSDLPGLVLSHQVPAGELYEGSFYWRFDHTDGDPNTELAVSGYTEDSIYGALALAAIVAQNLQDPNAWPEGVVDGLRSAGTVLLQGVDGTGAVRFHLVLGGSTMFVYAGEMLEALTSIGKLELALAGSQVSPSLPEN